MTPNLAFLACPTRSPFPKIAALAVLLASVSRAEIVNFDLDALPIQTGLFTSQTTPYDEQGLRLSSSTGGISLIGSSNNSFCGTMAYIPYLLGSTSITMQLFSPTGRRFTVKSATIHPYYSGASATIPFTGGWGGNLYSQSHATGTALAGVTVNFNSNFQRVGNLSWQMTYSGGLYNRFQISSIVGRVRRRDDHAGGHHGRRGGGHGNGADPPGLPAEHGHHGDLGGNRRDGDPTRRLHLSRG